MIITATFVDIFHQTQQQLKFQSNFNVIMNRSKLKKQK